MTGVYPQQYGISYYYDLNNNITSMNIINSESEGDYGYSIYVDHDESDKLFQIRYLGNYNYRKYNYSTNGLVDIIQDTGFPGKYHYEYNYNDNGSISSQTSWAGTETFSYDSIGRIVNWNYNPLGGGNGTQENYSYDATGNLLTKGSRTFTYNSANQINGFSYDDNGNLTNDGNFIYVYNSLNQIVEVKRASDQSLVATYTYNHNGLRRSKTVNGQTTYYVWDLFGNLVMENIPGVVNYSYYYDNSGNLIALKRNGVDYILHKNLRGDTESITDLGGNIVVQYHFDPWGNQITSSGSLAQPFRYAGYYFDSETGLYYLKSRYYSPALGRFLTRDDHKYIDRSDPQTLNLYSYARNNPVSHVDPNGNYDWDTDHELPADVQNQIVILTILWYLADTQDDRDFYHNAANDLRTKHASDKSSSGGNLTYTSSRYGIYYGFSSDIDNKDPFFIIGGGPDAGTPTVTYSPGDTKPGFYGFGESYPFIGGQVTYGPLGNNANFGGSVGVGLAGGGGIYYTNSFRNLVNILGNLYLKYSK